MAAYRVISADLRTGTRIAEIPINGLTYGQVLNGAGELSGSVPLPAGDGQLSAIFNDALDEVRRQLVVERDGVPVWAGIVWASPYNDETETREVRAAETWSYYRRRTIATRKVYRGEDQLVIGFDILDDANSVPAGNPGVTVQLPAFDVPLSGVNRDYAAEVYERKNVAEEIETLASLQDGFDFSIEPSWDPSGDLVKTFRWWYPRKGRTFPNTGWVFEAGRNLVDWDWPTDGTRYANRVIVTGGGDGPSTRSAVVTNAGQLLEAAAGGPGYPLIEHVVAETQEASQSNLQALALAELSTYSQEVVIPRLVVRGDVDPVFGSYVVGDTVRFVCQPGLSPRFPDGIDTRRRLIGYTVSVDDQGSEEIELLLGAEEAS